MTKTGRLDSYWTGVMILYAQGKHKFSTGQRPGQRRWRALMERIKNCPLTPPFGQTVRTFDIFGKKIPCKCGYHESGQQAETAAASQAVEVTSSRADTPDTPKSSAAAGSQESSAFTSMKCSLCAQEVLADQFTQHLSDYHVQEQCEHCGMTATGTLGLADHLEKCNVLKSPTGLPNISPATPTAPPSTPTAQDPQTSTLCPQDAPAPVCLTAQQTTADVCLLSAPAPPPVPEAPATQSGPPLLPAPAAAPPPAALSLPLRSPEGGRARFLPKPFLRVIKPGDQEWIVHILYEANGQLKQDVRQNWHHPPSPSRSFAPPNPHDYFRQRMFLWAPA